jgi:hypothetical protein
VFDDSLIVRSGQGWKALTFVCGSLVSALCLIAGFALFGRNEAAVAAYLILIGSVVLVCSLLFAYVSIRCSHCGARWVGLAITRTSAADWISVLLTQRVCPKCGR